MRGPLEPSWIFAMIVLGEALVLVGLMFLLSRLSGWRALSLVYACERPWDGQKRWMNWGRLRWVGYNGCLVLGQDAQGIYMHVWPFLNIGHVPLFIPRTEMSVKKGKSLFGDYGIISFARVPNVTLALSQRTLARLEL